MTEVEILYSALGFFTGFSVACLLALVMMRKHLMTLHEDNLETARVLLATTDFETVRKKIQDGKHGEQMR